MWRVIAFLALFLALSCVGCTPVAYLPGTAPIPTCRGQDAPWLLGWRKTPQHRHWGVVGYYTWKEWTVGQEVGTDPALNLTLYRGGRSRMLEMKVEGHPSITFVQRASCQYLDASGTLIFMAKHVADRFMW